MPSDAASRFMRLKAEIANAGGFGDGIDTSAYDLPSELGSVSCPQPKRAEVSVALLVELAATIDNSDWETARTSKLAQAARDALSQGWLNDRVFADAVRALDESEQRFFQALASVLATYVHESADSAHAVAPGHAAGDA